jgi:hypothetical protein
VSKPKKRKAVNFRIIAEMDGGEMTEPYRLLGEVREANHSDIREARVALAWRVKEKSDKDGRLVLGRCIKVSDLYREFADFDFIIALNQEVWDSIDFDRTRKVALLDHELCHAAPEYDEESGEHKTDERGRYLFRTRKHDIEEFVEIVHRHGCYKHDLEVFAQTLLERKKTPLFNPDKLTDDHLHPVSIQ